MHIWETRVHDERVLEWAGGHRAGGGDRWDRDPSGMDRTVDPLHIGCENKDSSKMLSLERGHSLRGCEAATANQRRAVVPGQSGEGFSPQYGQQRCLARDRQSLSICQMNECMNHCMISGKLYDLAV